jgi:hypothetical protein
LEIIKKAILTLGFIIAIPFGIYGLLLMQVVVNIISFYFNTLFSGKLINYPVIEQIRNILPIFGLAGLIGIFVYLIDLQLPPTINYDFVRLMVGFIFGMGIYILISYKINFKPLIDFRELILK